MLTARHANAPIVEECAAAARRREQVVANRVEDHALRDHAFVRERDGNAVLRKAVEEICGAVERVDDPHMLGRQILVATRAFLGEDRVIRIGRMQGFDDDPLGLAVDFTHVILRALGGDGEQVEIAGAAIDDVACAAGGLHGRREHRMHVGLSRAANGL